MSDELKHRDQNHISTAEWVSCAATLPPENQLVDTVIDDAQGRRNQANLKRRGNLWFTPDGGMYVYYTPTHWRNL